MIFVESRTDDAWQWVATSIQKIWSQFMNGVFFFLHSFSLDSHAQKDTLSQVRPVIVSLTIAWFWLYYYISESNFSSSDKKQYLDKLDEKTLEVKSLSFFRCSWEAKKNAKLSLSRARMWHLYHFHMIK